MTTPPAARNRSRHSAGSLRHFEERLRTKEHAAACHRRLTCPDCGRPLCVVVADAHEALVACSGAACRYSVVVRSGQLLYRRLVRDAAGRAA